MIVLVSFDGYMKEGGVRVYEGEPNEVMKQIASNHSYNQFDDDESPTVTEMIEMLKSTNGDGCDYITSIVEIKGEYEILLS